MDSTSPSPGENHPLSEVYDCLNSDSCIDEESSILASYLGSGDLNEEFYINGLLDSEKSEFVGILSNRGSEAGYANPTGWLPLLFIESSTYSPTLRIAWQSLQIASAVLSMANKGMKVLSCGL